MVRYRGWWLALPVLAAGLLVWLASGTLAARSAAAPAPAVLPTPEAASVFADFPRSPAANALAPTVQLAAAPPRALAVTPLPATAWRVGVTADGLYQLSYEALLAAGVPVTGAATADFHLSWMGQSLALDALDDGDALFEPGEAFIFYGEKFHGSEQDEKYTDENVYWLAVDSAAPGLRMTGRAVPPGGAPSAPWYTETVRAEQNTRYWARTSTAPGTDSTWFWDAAIVASTTPVVKSYATTLTSLAPGAYSATLRVEFAGQSVNWHNIQFTLNNIPVGGASWYGLLGHVATLQIPSTALVEGVNTLKVTVLTTGGTQRLYFDRFDITYRRRFTAAADRLAFTAPVSGATAFTLTGFTAADVQLYDISAPLQSVRLTSATVTGSAGNYTVAFQDTPAAGAKYAAAAGSALRAPASLARYQPPADILTSTTGADVIMIVPAEFEAALQPLVARRESQGRRVKVVHVEDIYPLFNGGVLHPEAIRALIVYASANWPAPAPRYLLLVGDGHFNFKGYNPALYGAFVPVRIPPYLAFLDPDQGEVPVDTRYGDLDGDGLPELMVGRLPVNSAAELSAVVQKLLAYEDLPPDAWMHQALFVADDGNTYDEGYASTLDKLSRDYVPVGVQTATVYMKDYCGAIDYTKCPSATRALTETWSQGAALLTYSGHGSIHRWAHEPLIYNTQLPTLRPHTGLPFLLSMDCWDGYWMFPPKYPAQDATDVRSIGEWTVVALADRGAIATFGPAGLGYLNIENAMARAIYNALFNSGDRNLGGLTRVARNAVPSSYLARTYTLIGDPTLNLPVTLIATGLTVTPATLELPAGQPVDLNALLAATLRKRSGGSIPVTPVWSAGSGAVDSAGIYTPPTTLTTTWLTALYAPFTATVTVTVTAAAPYTITVQPDPLIIQTKDSAQMTADVRDQWGNPSATPPVWSASVGTIDAATGRFTATQGAASGWITATIGEVSGRAEVFIEDDPVALLLTPTAITVVAGQPVDINALVAATLTLNSGASFPITPTWSAANGAVDGAGIYTPPTTLMTTWLTALYAPFTATVTVTVTADALYTITVQPDPLIIQTGAAAQMMADARDQWGNPIAALPVWSASVGTIDAATGRFTATQGLASGWITATVGAISGRAEVFIEDDPVTLLVAPTAITVAAGQPVDINSVVTATIVRDSGDTVRVTPVWSAGSGAVDGAGIYTPPTVITTTWLTALYAPFTATVTVTVTAAAPYTITVQPNPLLMQIGTTAQMTAAVRDQWGNPIAATPMWSASVGTIDAATGRFTATLQPSAGWITATAHGLVGRAPVTIVDNVIARVEVLPATATLTLHERAVFTATAYNQWGETLAATFTWSTTLGTVDGQGNLGNYTAPGVTGVGKVRATAGAVYGEASVTVNARIFLPLVLRNP